MDIAGYFFTNVDILFFSFIDWLAGTGNIPASVETLFNQ
jgi:hypothetical protein